jgi:hypothetical protein
MMYELKVRNGTYKANNWMALWWAVLCHRMSHLRKGEGFAD